MGCLLRSDVFCFFLTLLTEQFFFAAQYEQMASMSPFVFPPVQVRIAFPQGFTYLLMRTTVFPGQNNKIRCQWWVNWDITREKEREWERACFVVSQGLQLFRRARLRGRTIHRRIKRKWTFDHCI